ncbi:MAG: hypothetical protein IPL61_34025 [Myxococcales bacterium]|nr:hypothetical protein [Myxococcales bacterium]
MHRTPLFEDRYVAPLTRLLTDDRWPWLPSIVRPTQRPGQPLYPWRGGKTARAALPGVVADVLRSELTEGVNLVASRTEAGNNAWYNVESGRPGHRHASQSYPFDARGLCRTDVPTGKGIDAWLALVRELAATLDPGNGIIAAEADERVLLARIFVQGSPQPRMPPDHPANESSRIARVRDVLGERYVRPPAWATFLRRAHVDAVGGRDHLLAVVQPPVVHDVGDLLYLQLSASVADALAPETEARRRALAELLAPITVPLADPAPAG